MHAKYVPEPGVYTGPRQNQKLRTNLQEFRRISLYDQTRLARFSRR
jgi:hypothetical protein